MDLGEIAMKQWLTILVTLALGSCAAAPALADQVQPAGKMGNV